MRHCFLSKMREMSFVGEIKDLNEKAGAVR